MKIKINRYPYDKDFVFCFTIDDIHTESIKDEEWFDFWYDIKNWSLKYISDIIKMNSDIKFTLFAVPNRIDRPDKPNWLFFPLRKLYRTRHTYDLWKFDITNQKYVQWINDLNNFFINNIEIWCHWLYHHNKDVNLPWSQEFIWLSYQKQSEIFDEMIKKFNDSWLIVSKWFRAPWWWIDKNLIKILSDKNFIYTSSSSDFTTKITKNSLSNYWWIKWQKIIYENYLENNVLNFVANCYPYQTQRAVDIANNNWILILHSHIVKTQFWLVSLDDNSRDMLDKIIREIKLQTLKKPWFATLNELSEFIISRDNVRYEIIEWNKIKIFNDSKYLLKWLTLNIDNKNYVIDDILSNTEIVFDPNENNKKENKKVSVVLTVYNWEKNVVESLQSLCDQTYNNMEIIVVNDWSKDNTEMVLDNYIKEKNDNRIKVLNQKNWWRSNARNSWFKMSDWDIITFCEDDAKYSKDYIKTAVFHFNNNLDKLWWVIWPHYVWNKNESFNTRVKDIERRKNFKNYNPKSCWFYDKNVFKSIWMFNENLELVEDVEPALKLSKMWYKFIFEPDAMWLHKEPPMFFKYLRRKMRWWIWMALLKKSWLKDSIVPLKYILFLIICFIVSCIFIYIDLWYMFYMFLLLLISLLLIRFKDIKDSLSVTNESFLFVIFWIYVEYVWWISTFIWYIYWLTMSADEINKYLKWR